MKRMSLLILLLGLAFGTAYTQTQNKTYEDFFSKMNESNYEQLIASMKTGDYDMAYGAIKRIGELKITNARNEIFDWLGKSNPIANAGKQSQSEDLRQIFNISVWTLSQIGNGSDAKELSSYLKDVQDIRYRESQKFILRALGELHPSPDGLDTLQKYALEVKDYPLAEETFQAILKHNKKNSSITLVQMSKRAELPDDFRKRVYQAAVELLKTGE